jgi:hypothetical protein
LASLVSKRRESSGTASSFKFGPAAASREVSDGRKRIRPTSLTNSLNTRLDDRGSNAVGD